MNIDTIPVIHKDKVIYSFNWAKTIIIIINENNKRTNNNKQRIKIPQSTNVYEKKIYKDHVYQVENHK